MDTPRLELHLGFHKTATSWFQREVWPRWPGIDYLGKPWRDDIDGWTAAVRARSSRCGLICSESLSGSLTSVYRSANTWLQMQNAKLTQIREALMPGRRLGVILGMRRHDHWLLSIYKHYLKYGGYLDLPRFIGRDGLSGPSLFGADDLRFAARVAAIEDRLDVQPFLFFVEEIREAPAALWSDLSEYLGCGSGPAEVPAGRQHNEGVRSREAAMVRRLNRIASRRGAAEHNGILPRLEKRPHKLVTRLSRAKLIRRGAPLQMPEDIRRGILEDAAADLRAVEQLARRVRPGYRLPGSLTTARDTASAHSVNRPWMAHSQPAQSE